MKWDSILNWVLSLYLRLHLKFLTAIESFFGIDSISIYINK